MPEATVPAPEIEDKTVNIPVDKLAKITDFMELQQAINKKVEDYGKNLLTKETFQAEMGDLIKAQVAEQMKAARVVEEGRRIKFGAGDMATDKCIHGFQKAMKAPAGAGRNKAMTEALLAPSGNEDVKKLKDVSDELYMLDTLMRHDRDYQGMKSLRTYQRFRDLGAAVTKAVTPMDTTDTADWVPTGLSSNIIDLPRVTGQLEPLFQHIACPTKVYEYPLNLNGPDVIADLVAEATTNTNNPGDTFGQTITDGKITFTASKLRSRLITSVELTEDAIIAMIPAMRVELRVILDNTAEACILNGDTTATHQDTDIEALGTNDGRKAWKGLRKLFLAGSLTKDCSSGNISDGNLIAIKKLAGKWAVNPNEGVWIPGVKGYCDMTKLTNVVTVDKYGPAASVVTGEVAKYHGSPVIISEHQREDVDENGVNAASGNDYAVIMYVNKRYFYIGDRRLITLDAEKWATTEQINLLAFRRLDFEPFATPSTTYSLGAMGYKITV